MSSSNRMVLRFVDVSKKQGVEHAAILLKDSWRLSWTRALINDSDPLLYMQALHDLIKLLQKDYGVALLRPDEEFHCLRRFDFQSTPAPVQPPHNEIQHLRRFLLAVTRRIFEKLGQPNPYMLCIDDLDQRLAQAARNARHPADALVPELPPLIRRFVLDRGFTTKHILKGSSEAIGITYNEWRMENGLDPIYHPLLQPCVHKFRQAVQELLQRRDHQQQQRSDRARPSPRPSVVSVEGGELGVGGAATTSSTTTGQEDQQQQQSQERRDSYAKLDLVVPSLCLRYTKGRGVSTLAVTETASLEELADDIIRWRKEKDMGALTRSQIMTNIIQWKRNVELVFRSSSDTGEDHFLESLDQTMQQFLQDEKIRSSDDFLAADVDTLKGKYRSWRSSSGLSADIHSDMQITDGRSRVSRLQAAACSLKRPGKEKRLSELYQLKQQKESQEG